jgi:hypothetical protein
VEELLDSLWGVSPILEKASLVAILAGLFVVTFAVVRHFSGPSTNEIRVSNSLRWKGWLALGLALLVIGMAVDAIAIWVRLSPPGRF